MIYACCKQLPLAAELKLNTYRKISIREITYTRSTQNHNYHNKKQYIPLRGDGLYVSLVGTNVG